MTSIDYLSVSVPVPLSVYFENEPRNEKTCFFHICKNKGADQLRGNCAADQRLCFRYIENTNPLLPESENFKSLAIFFAVQLGLCPTWSVLMTGLKY